MSFWITLNLILFNEQILSKSHPDPDCLTDSLRDERSQQSREMGYCCWDTCFIQQSLSSHFYLHRIFFTLSLSSLCVCVNIKIWIYYPETNSFPFRKFNSKTILWLCSFCCSFTFPLHLLPKVSSLPAYICTFTATESFSRGGWWRTNAWPMFKCDFHFSLPSEFFSWKNIILFFFISAYFMQIELEMAFNPAYLRCEKCNKGEICWQR